MIVSYSSLNRFEPPKLALCNPGSVATNGILSNMVGFITNVSDAEIVFNFNAPSELSFRTVMTHDNEGEEQEYIYNVYKAIQNRRLIYADNIGYFMITDVVDGFDNGEAYKDVTAQSIEVEIQQKMLPYIENNSYRFDVDDLYNEGLLAKVLSSIPLWTVSHIDSSVSNRVRTFEDVDSSMNCLSFMIENMQDAYECIFIFNPINRQISVYDQSNFVRTTDIHLTKHDVINSLNIVENADDIYTSLTVLGDENMTIAAINPIGNNTIYDFSYYTSWMSGQLGTKVLEWQNLIDESKDAYRELNESYYTNLQDAYEDEYELQKIEIQRTMYQRCRNNIVAERDTSTVASYNAVIVENGGTAITVYTEIQDTLDDIDSLIQECNESYSSVESRLAERRTTIADIVQQIETYHNTLAIDSYFTSSELNELSNYIFEGSFVDEYSIITDVMDYNQQFEQMDILYNRAKQQLSRVSKPSQEFNINVENFLFAKEFEHWSEQLETGCLINVELDTDDVALLFMSNITVNYEDCSLSMTFGNRFNKYDAKSLFNDALGNVNRTANSLNYVKETIYPIKNGEFDEMKEALRTSRDITMASALAADNQDIVIDASGYTGRKRNADGTIDSQQIKITGKSIVFTDDAWESSRTAIGEILLGNGTSTYGINAETIYGDILIGEKINLVNSNNSMRFDEDGLYIANGASAITISPNNTRGIINIRTYNTEVFSINQSGRLTITGDINADGGHIGTFEITGDDDAGCGNLVSRFFGKSVVELRSAKASSGGMERRDGQIILSSVSEEDGGKYRSNTLFLTDKGLSLQDTRHRGWNSDYIVASIGSGNFEYMLRLSYGDTVRIGVSASRDDGPCIKFCNQSNDISRPYTLTIDNNGNLLWRNRKVLTE